MLLIILYVFIVGICIGSFLNVVILRAFSEESIVLPRSKCMKCAQSLRWYDNIPLLSYMMLKGKCRYCGSKISRQYFIVEFLTGIIFVILFCRFGISLELIILLPIVSLFVVISATDIKEQVVFCRHVYILMVLGLLYGLAKGYIVESLIGLLLGYVLIELLSFVTVRFLGKRAFGEGDSLILGAIGAIVGYNMIPAVFLLSILLQGITIFPSFIINLYKRREYGLVAMMFIFIVISVMYKLLEYLGVIMAEVSILLLVFTILIGIVLSWRLLIKVRRSQAVELQYFPFGPALLIACLVMIIYRG